MNSLLVFGIFAAGLIALSLWALFRPLLAHTAASGDDPELGRRLAVLRDRKHEIEADREAGRLSSADAEQAIERLAIELSETLGPNAAGASAQSATGVAPVKWLAAVLGLVLPVAAVMLYLVLGAPQIIAIDPTLAGDPTTPEQLAQTIVDLKKRTEQNPQDLPAWAMVAQAQRLAGDVDASLVAFKRATELAPAGAPETARLFAEYAETLVTQRNGEFIGEPLALLEQALKHNPDDQKALGLMGAGLYRVGRPEQGLGHLRKLLASLPVDSDQNKQIGAVVQRIESELRAAAAAGGASATAPNDAGAAGSNSASATSTSKPALTGQIKIADALRAKLPNAATVFIVARPADGQRLPIAVSRQPFAKLPFEFVLGDEQSMTPDRKLSGFDQVILEARISVSGNAIRQSGDLIGTSKPIKLDGAAVELLIDQVVP